MFLANKSILKSLDEDSLKNENMSTAVCKTRGQGEEVITLYVPVPILFQRYFFAIMALCTFQPIFQRTFNDKALLSYFS